MPTGGGTTVCDAVLGIILLRFTTVVTPVIALVYTHSLSSLTTTPLCSDVGNIKTHGKLNNQIITFC